MWEPTLEYAPEDKVYLDGMTSRLWDRPKASTPLSGPYVVEHHVGANGLPSPPTWAWAVPPCLSSGQTVGHTSGSNPWRLSHPLRIPFWLTERSMKLKWWSTVACSMDGLQVPIQWKGYSYEHNSWEDATDVHSLELVTEFHSPILELHASTQSSFHYISFNPLKTIVLDRPPRGGDVREPISDSYQLCTPNSDCGCATPTPLTHSGYIMECLLITSSCAHLAYLRTVISHAYLA